MKIIAIIGNESHSTSSGWFKISRRGVRLSHRDAVSAEWQTKFGDRHAAWVECVFDLPEGATLEVEAGANSGPRGTDRRRLHLLLEVSEETEQYASPNLGYPCSGSIRGRLRVVRDYLTEKSADHQRALDEARQ